MPTSFESQLIALCRELEKWRAQCKETADSALHDFPPFERKAATQALVFTGLFLISSYVAPFVQRQHSTMALVALASALLISGVSGPMLFGFQALGLAKPQFWRALFHAFFGPKGNYPFTPLLQCIEHDFTQQERLRGFHTHVLTAAEQRIEYEEADLRERLNSFIGSPTVLVAFGLTAGSITAWDNYHSHPGSILNGIIFWGSIGTLLLGVFGLRLRISLTELARCRSLLSLEIDRRASFNIRDDEHRRFPRSRKFGSKR